MSDAQLTTVLDAYSPAEIAHRVETVGVSKVRMNVLSKFVLALLAGAFIALGANGFTVTVTGAPATGLTRIAGGGVFCLGLILVIVAGAELFTGNTLKVMAFVSRRIRMVELLRGWLIVYAGNFAGAVAIAAVVYLSGQAGMLEGRVGQTMVAIASAKLGYTFVQAVALGTLCNALVCLAVWLAFGSRSVADKVLAILPPITVFVAAGFEHSVANMYFVPLGIMVDGGATPGLTWTAFLWRNLLPVTLGNIFGGAVLVGAAYWFIYLRGGSGQSASRS